MTQALLGATVAQAGYSRRLGRSALAWGALIGILPDFDVLAAPLHGGFGEMLYHRGSTHALWFGPVVGSAMGWVLWRWRDGAPGRLRAWVGLCVWVLVTHPLLDVFTPYGTQLLAPFSRARFAWNGIGIIDPIYTAMLAGGFVWGAVQIARQRQAAAIALALSSLYLSYGVLENHRARADLRTHFASRDASTPEVRVYPTLLQPWLRRFVARTPEALHVGLYTSWQRERPWWRSAPTPPSDPRVDDLLATWEGGVFRWFAMEEITWRVREGRGGAVVEIDDLRYGLPGAAPDRGMWGVRARYDAAGVRHGAVERFARRGTLRAGPIIRSIWRATWGDFSDFEPRVTARRAYSTPTGSEPAAMRASSSANPPGSRRRPASSGPSAG